MEDMALGQALSHTHTSTLLSGRHFALLTRIMDSLCCTAAEPTTWFLQLHPPPPLLSSPVQLRSSPQPVSSIVLRSHVRRLLYLFSDMSHHRDARTPWNCSGEESMLTHRCVMLQPLPAILLLDAQGIQPRPAMSPLSDGTTSTSLHFFDGTHVTASPPVSANCRRLRTGAHQLQGHLSFSFVRSPHG